MKPIITINATDILAAVLLCIFLVVLILGELTAFLYRKFCDFMRRHREHDKED